MESQGGQTAHSLPDPDEARRDRDRALALAYVRKGQGKKAAAEVAAEAGVYRRKVYRAIEREREWAEAESERLKAEGSDGTHSQGGDE